MSIQVELSTIGEVTGEQLARRVPLVSSLRVCNESDRAMAGSVLVAVDGAGSPTEVSFDLAPGEELLRLGVDVDRGDVDGEVLVVTAVAVSDGAVVGSAGGAVLTAPDVPAGENPESGGRFHRFRRSLSRLRGRDETGEGDAQPESAPDTSEQVADAVGRAIRAIQRRLDADSAAAEHAEREAAERAAAEREAAERETAERAAAEREAAEREAERLAAEAAQHEAAEHARREAERAEQERVAREAAEHAERERVERAAAEEAARDAAERAAQEASEQAARDQAAEQARAAAARDAAERAEREAAERVERERVIREAAEQVAREAAERAAAEQIARAQVEQETAQRAASEAAEHAAAAKAAQEQAEREAADAAARERAEQAAAASLPAAAPAETPPPRAAVEVPDRPGEPLPGELPFEPWDGGWRGGRIVLDNLTATANKRLVTAALVEGINGEGPVHIDRLTRLVCAAFETRKVTAARVTELAALIPKSTQASEDGAVLWPARRSPTEWDGFRGAVDTEPRASEHIPLRELANAMVALLNVRGPMSRTELFGVTRRVFGGKRVTPAVEARFVAALEDAAGQHRLTIDGDRVATA